MLGPLPGQSENSFSDTLGSSCVYRGAMGSFFFLSRYEIPGIEELLLLGFCETSFQASILLYLDTNLLFCSRFRFRFHITIDLRCFGVRHNRQVYFYKFASHS